MEILSSTNKYLKGEDFSAGYSMKIAEPQNKIIYRHEFLLDISQNKNILHIGCVDHLPLLEEKIQKRNWLHQLLCEKASICWGVDINKEGIDKLHELGFKETLFLNVVEDEVPEELKNIKWDYVIMGEILEHVDNPVQFLQQLNDKFRGLATNLIITVPHAFRLRNFKDAFRGRESINTDHRFWFTPFTLGKVVSRAGLDIDAFYLCSNYVLWKYSILNRFLFKRFPALCDSLVMIARFK